MSRAASAAASRVGAPECSYSGLYNTILCINFSATGAGYAISLITTPKSAQLAANAYMAS